MVYSPISSTDLPAIKEGWGKANRGLGWRLWLAEGKGLPDAFDLGLADFSDWTEYKICTHENNYDYKIYKLQ